MEDFFPGQRVICVDAKDRLSPEELAKLPFANPVAFLREGAIYTVRELDTSKNPTWDGATLRLEEIRGPDNGGWEIGFSPTRFRPIKSGMVALNNIVELDNPKAISNTKRS